MDKKEIAGQTLEILEKESYRSPAGKIIDLSDDLERCLENTECYLPEELRAIRNRLEDESEPPRQPEETDFEVRNETTLEGSRRLALQEGYDKVGVLNFASARHPGGGFLKGAQAQEESLARSSGLYFSLKQCSGYYEYHRSHRSALYSDRMIWSPGCPVFRTDDGSLLNRIYKVSFITSPAPNAGAVRRNEPENIREIKPVLRRRSAKILSLALHRECNAMVLGAWGCGVFQNHPQTVSKLFRSHLGPTGSYYNKFKKVLFSVLDKSGNKKTIQPFREMFGNSG